MTESKQKIRRSYELSEEACDVLASASVWLRRHPSDLVSEAIVNHFSEVIKDHRKK